METILVYLFATSRPGPGYLQRLLAIWKVDNEDLRSPFILQMSKLGLLLQLSNQPNEYTKFENWSIESFK